MKLTEEQSEFVERVGRWWEAAGSRTAGRILGWLMICDPPYRSAAQLVTELGVSAGSVSTQIRPLDNVGFIDKVTFPGDRATYYQLKPDVWAEIMSRETEYVKTLRDIAEAGTHVLPKERPERVTGLGLVTDFLLERWPAVLDEMIDYLEKAREQ